MAHLGIELWHGGTTDGHARRVVARATLGMVVLLGGCSLLEDDAEPAAEVADEAPTTTRPGTAHDAQLARTALLTLTDFGPGWSEIPLDPSDPYEGLYDERDRRLSECGDSSRSDEFMGAQVGEAMAESGTFTLPDTDSTVTHSVGLSPDAATAAAGMAALEDPALPACLQDVFRWFVETAIDNPPDPTDTLPEGASVGNITVARLNVAPKGEQTAAFRVTLPVQIQGLTVTQYFDLVYVRSGRALSQLSFGSVLEPFDTPSLDWVTAAAANRLEAVGASPATTG